MARDRQPASAATDAETGPRRPDKQRAATASGRGRLVEATRTCGGYCACCGQYDQLTLLPSGWTCGFCQSRSQSERARHADAVLASG